MFKLFLQIYLFEVGLLRGRCISILCVLYSWKHQNDDVHNESSDEEESDKLQTRFYSVCSWQPTYVHEFLKNFMFNVDSGYLIELCVVFKYLSGLTRAVVSYSFLSSQRVKFGCT